MSRIHTDAEIAAMSLIPHNNDLLIALAAYANKKGVEIDIKICPQNATNIADITVDHGKRCSTITANDVNNIQDADNKTILLSRIISDLFY